MEDPGIGIADADGADNLVTGIIDVDKESDNPGTGTAIVDKVNNQRTGIKKVTGSNRQQQH